mmetsp:Transcript_7655/g.13230  ORF Transcript_7655/g.13230 Transcript_7655/m.13230 type:complete len:256 (+) Transcript_7655:1026-1793(+)
MQQRKHGGWKLAHFISGRQICFCWHVDSVRIHPAQSQRWGRYHSEGHCFSLLGWRNPQHSCGCESISVVVSGCHCDTQLCCSLWQCQHQPQPSIERQCCCRRYVVFGAVAHSELPITIAAFRVCLHHLECSALRAEGGGVLRLEVLRPVGLFGTAHRSPVGIQCRHDRLLGYEMGVRQSQLVELRWQRELQAPSCTVPSPRPSPSRHAPATIHHDPMGGHQLVHGCGHGMVARDLSEHLQRQRAGPAVQHSPSHW